MRIQRLDEDECYGVLTSAGFGRLACARDDQPHVVPVYFVVSGHFIYSFALPGRKVDWMRSNPKICLETDLVVARDDWTSVVVTGRYEELDDAPEFEAERELVQRLFQRRPMWWEPGAVSLDDHDGAGGYVPIIYRVNVASISGYRGTPAAEDRPRL